MCDTPPASLAAQPHVRCATSSVTSSTPTQCELSFEAATANGGVALRDALATHGYALVRGVVPDATTCARWTTDIKQFIVGLGFGSDFKDPAVVFDATKWPQRGCPGVLECCGAGQLESAWLARLDARVRAVFAAIWRTRQLVTSIDAVCAQRPTGRSCSDADAIALHTDQNAYRPEFDAVQGVLSLTPTHARGGGTSLVAHSHAHAPRLLSEQFPCAEMRDDHALNWHVLSDEETGALLAIPGCELIHVETEPGDILLWDSRTVHCGRAARDPLPYDAWRFGMYICMWPAHRLRAADREAKRRSMGLGLGGGRAETTTHWPDGRELKPRYGWLPGRDARSWEGGLVRPPEAKGEGVVAPPAVALTTSALRLAGVLPYDEEEEPAV